jgi:two-component system response regulator PilR (NtrC family)
MVHGMRTRETRREGATTAREGLKRLVPWSGGPVILLVEDDDDMREMLAAVLRRDGYRVVEAADGDDALDWLGVGILEGQPERLPALIVSDICLPWVSGFEILEGARLSPWRLPVILITGFGDAETHERARELGAVCVLDKPFAMDALREAVRDALRPVPRRSPWERDGHVT